MGSRMKVLALSGTLALGIVLCVSAPGSARQNIQPGSEPQQTNGDFGGAQIILVNHNAALLSWQESSDPRVEGYNIWKGTDPKNMSAKKVGNVTSYTFNKLDMAKTWYFGVSAYGRIGKTKTESPISPLVPKWIAPATGKKH